MHENKILVVDDEPEILNLINRILSKEGYQVFCVDNGAEAIEEAKKESPQLIIADVVLPDMNGAEVVEAIHNAGLKDVSVLFMTAMITRSEEEQDMSLTVENKHYYAIAKPFDPVHLVALVKDVLNKQVS